MSSSTTRFLFSMLMLMASNPGLAVDFGDTDCVIEPHVSVDLSTSVDGIVEEILVDRGDVIEEGQVLVHLEAGVEKSAVEQARLRTLQRSEIELAENRLLFAKKKRDRTMQLFADKVISELTRDEAELELTTAMLELKRAEENQARAVLELKRAEEVLKLRRIVSPIDGIVVRRLVAEGEAIGEQQTVLLKIVQIDPLNVELVVPASQFGSFDVGNPLRVQPEPPGVGSYVATIEVIDPVIDASSGTFGVRATLPNPGLKIPAGLICRVDLNE